MEPSRLLRGQDLWKCQLDRPRAAGGHASLQLGEGLRYASPPARPTGGNHVNRRQQLTKPYIAETGARLAWRRLVCAAPRRVAVTCDISSERIHRGFRK